MYSPKTWAVSGQELWQWRDEACAAAHAAAISSAEVDWLLQELAGLDRLTLRLESFKHWPQVQLRLSLPELTELWQKRIEARVPVQYLAGTAPWRQFNLTVSPAVLIPRPETELIIDLAVVAAQSFSPELGSSAAEIWADLGTGSGAIAIGLATAFPKATVYAVDCSPDAIAVAQQNATDLGLSDRVQFRQGAWFQPLAGLEGQLRGMVSNPPYIPSAMVSSLQPEVAWHEPHLALDGGEDGLDCIRHLVATAPPYLKPGGIWLIEMMAGQAEQVVELLERQGDYDRIQVHADLAGIDRFVLAHRR
ncbi:peptide chain release factor N(5)-glutamine methyltransferase [Trichocoleus sp. FACHB-591]|uniref:peptide chain release factor N(5)-glutamine methyltransferase n=1 Tax=Trichocoleus sp. FACHB-591 TaxID=2692872 RepID=UPI001682FBF5|nr:peptide chain release factor N(5)-glutamine methyltransferase [Trichocoleus sp. FACHB-591]MBD2098919.1 peptide chain release factor N(5)-glutamine methyltransferase [Trichocoleus sp. FACHB-591]